MEKVEKWLIRSWERIKHKVDYALTGQDPDEVEWDAFLNRMVAVRTGIRGERRVDTVRSTSASSAGHVSHYDGQRQGADRPLVR